MSVLDKVRHWIDGDSAEMVLEQAARDAQIKPRSIAEEFIVKIARSVEEVMQREMVPLPQGTTLIPTEYIVFLSEEDDREWQGAKRKGLEQGLYHILAERAKEISGKKKLETQSFAIELRVDGTMEKGEVRIQHGWEDHSSTGKTNIVAKPKPQQPRVAPPVVQTPNFTAPPPNSAAARNPNFEIPPPPMMHESQQIIQPNEPPPYSPSMPPPTVVQNDMQQYVPHPTQQQSGDGEVMTQVQARAQELFKIEIWRDGVRQNVVPIYNAQVSIGRGSKSTQVDLILAGDPEISRRHATIFFDGRQFTLMNEGRNATIISNREIPMGQRVAVAMGEPIGIGAYLIRIQPR